MQKYTVFIKPITLLPDEERERLREDVQEALRHNNPKEVGANEFEIEVSGDEGPRIGDWNRFKNVTDGRAYLVWCRHENEGVTVSSFPEGADDALGELLRKTPHARLQVIREYLQSIL